jgi:subtilase family serine protease
LVVVLQLGPGLPTTTASATTVERVDRIVVSPSLPPNASFGTPLAASRRLDLDVVLRPRDPVGLARLASAVSTPGASRYRQYLTRDEFANEFGATPNDIDTVDRVLRSLGLEPGQPSTNRLVIPVSGTVDAVQRAFQVGLRHVSIADKPDAYSTPNVAVVPGNLIGYVGGIVGLTNVMQPRSLARPLTPASATPDRPTGHSSSPSVPHVVSGDTGATACSTVKTLAATYAAADHVYPNSDTVLDSFYGLSSLYSSDDIGAGVTVAVYEVGGYTPADIVGFQGCYGTNAMVNPVNVDGGPGAGYLSDYRSVAESELDIETVIGTAPGAVVDVYQGPDVSSATDQNQLDIWNRIVSDDTAQVVSVSWALCERYVADDPSFVSAQNMLFEEAATQGQSILAAAGDTGSAGCIRNDNAISSLYVSNPASSPWVTGVGGTENIAFASQYLATIGTTVPAEEGAWNDGCADGTIDDSCAGGGGGISILSPRPTWQTGPGVDNPEYPNLGREVPDVSASADYNRYPYLLYDTDQLGGWSLNGGTSAAAPLWAGVIALVDARCQSVGVSAVGFADPILYTDAVQHPTDFYDVTTASGVDIGTPPDNDVTGTHNGAYPATVGYDMADGLGTPHGATLASDLCQSSAPAAPTGVHAVSDATDSRSGGLTVMFASGDNDGAPITAFTVTCTSNDGGATERAVLDAAIAAPVNVNGVTTKKRYRCTTTATNLRGTSPPSAVSAAVTVGAPGQPAKPSVSRIGTGHVKVSFTNPAGNGAPLTSFKAVCASTNGGAARGKTGTASPLGVSGLTPSKTYSCNVRATNRRGTGQTSAQSSALIA